MNKKIELIDFLKGFSIFTIVAGHFLSQLSLPDIERKIVQIGGTGVHTFILVSGFGLYLSHLKKKLNYVDFIKKRFTKIYLPYLLIVMITALISFIIPVSGNSWYAFLGHVFLYKMFDPNIMSTYGYQFWFISTIIQLYLIFQLLAWLKQKLSSTAFISLGLFISVSWILLVLLLGKEENASWIRFCFQYIWEFMLGMALAEIYIRRTDFWKIKQIYLLLTAIAGFTLFGILVLQLGDVGRMLNDIPAMLGYTALAIFIYQLHVKMINNFFLFTGTISYSLYLTHVLIFSVADYFLTANQLQLNLAFLVFILAITYLISYFYHQFIVRYL